MLAEPDRHGAGGEAAEIDGEAEVYPDEVGYVEGTGDYYDDPPTELGGYLGPTDGYEGEPGPELGEAEYDVGQPEVYEGEAGSPEDAGGYLVEPDELDGDPSGPGGLAQPPVRTRRRRRPFLVGLLVLVVAIVVVAVVAFVRVSNDIHPSGRPGRVVTVTLPRGASTLRIADLLAKAGVIHGPDVFELYVKFEGGGPLLAGTYRLPTNESFATVISALESGPIAITYKLVVPEGFTVRQIAGAVGALHDGITASEFLAAATSNQVRSPYEPAGTKDLEGMLFPATYPVPQGETADGLVQWMVATFDSHAQQLGLAQAAQKLHRTPYQVIEVASIVEREAKLEPDRGPIASVIYNRLARGMPIGAESTLLYALGNPSGPVDITESNPYNTLVNKGLPPTPISNPGIPSLEAAMSPPHTTYLYWVEVNPDGKMGYATTEAQFRQLQHDCRVVHLC